MSQKINVLVLPSDKTGVGKFRSTDPHVMLQNMYPDDFHVDIDYEPKINDVSYWKKYQIVHVHRNIGNDYSNTPNIINFLKSLGIQVVVDLDDYWLPTIEHPIHHLILQNKIHERIMDNLRAASHITTTTTVFADEIKKLNKNVVVFPNAIDPNESQFKQKTEESDRIRIGWLGGSSHLHDLMLLDGFVQKNGKEINDKIQYVLCGFDIRGTMTEINKETGEQKQRPILPHETVWARYEEIFTDKYSIVGEDYKKFLLNFDEVVYPSETGLPYRRVWTKPVTSYAMNYSKLDVSLAPIKNHIFNRMKSQLKVIEAGFYKKALIASEIGPYTIDLKHCLKNGEFVDGNALLVNENRNHSDWSKFIKKLVNNPNLITDMGERLYETVKDTYDLRNVTKARAEWYKTIVK
jgi:glycosyltransferase involved in cell wall biosynthesis